MVARDLKTTFPKRWRPESFHLGLGKGHFFFWNPQPVFIKLIISIFIMKNGKGIFSIRYVFKFQSYHSFLSWSAFGHDPLPQISKKFRPSRKPQGLHFHFCEATLCTSTKIVFWENNPAGIKSNNQSKCFGDMILYALLFRK